MYNNLTERGEVMTWDQLGKEIDGFSDQQKKMDLSIYLNRSDEFLPVNGQIRFSEENNDVLDDQHPYLSIDF